MATNNPRATTSLLGLARQIDPDGSIATIAEVLDEAMPVFVDAQMVRSNGITSHRITRRTSLPAPSWTKINQGVTAARGDTSQIEEEIGILETRCEIDERLLDIAPDPEKFRQNENRPHLEAMAQEFGNTFVAGSRTSSPEEFDGLETRYYTLDASTNYQTVFDNGESSGSTNTSIWLIQWSPTGAYLIYPRNSSTIGITQENMGREKVLESGSTTAWYYAWVTRFILKIGLAVQDVRCIKRICNINSDRTDAQSLNEDVLIEAINEFPNTANGVVGYMNRDVQTQLEILAKDKTNVFYTPDGPFGRPQMHFRGIPIHRLDAITSTESALT